MALNIAGREGLSAVFVCNFGLFPSLRLWMRQNGFGDARLLGIDCNSVLSGDA